MSLYDYESELYPVGPEPQDFDWGKAMLLRLPTEETTMQFLVKAYDGEGMLNKRMEVRPRHLEGMKALGKQIICAGGLLDVEGKMKGSALVMEFQDRAALEEYLKNEPYVVEGVWQKIEVEAMNVVLVNGEKRS